MALDSRFVVTADLQGYFVHKDTGLPLAGGTVTFYEDENRTTLKDVYELTGTPPNYTYTQLPNPLNLSSVGTYMDDSNNDVVPYYFPYDGTPTESTGTVQLYYAVVRDANGVEQLTREGCSSGT